MRLPRGKIVDPVPVSRFTFSMKPFLCLVVCSFVASVLPAQTADADGALSAISAVPERLRNGIVKLSADNGTPNPPAWYFVAKNDSGEVFSITVTDGQVTSEKPFLDLRALFTAPAAINLSKLQIGSNGAWAAAQKYAAGRGKTLASVSYALEQKGRDAVPLWSVWCYAADGSYIGFLEILATTGAVVSSE